MSEDKGGRLRPLRPDDLDRVVEVDERIVGRTRRRFFEKRLEAALADEKGFIAVAATGADDNVEGYAIARLQDGEFGGDHRLAVIDVIGVDPQTRRAGHGKLILDGVTTYADKAGAQEVRTQIDWQSRDLIRFFAGAGFAISDQYILECRARDIHLARDADEATEISQQNIDGGVPDYSDPGGDDFTALSRDRVFVRSMRKDDLNAVVRIDAKFTGRDRRGYYEAKLQEVLSEGGVRVSLLAEVDELPVGYIMARVDYGEYGRTEPAAVIDTLGVHPGFGHHGVGSALMSQLLVNLDALDVETVRTNVTWNNTALLGFLGRSGFSPAQRLALSRPIHASSSN